MALTNSGTVVALSNDQIPDGYTLPSVITFNDPKYQLTQTINITKTDVHNADPATTLDNIINDSSNGIDAVIEAEIANDFDTTGNTVTIYNRLTNLSNNYVNVTGDGDYLTTTVAVYECTVTTYIRIT